MTPTGRYYRPLRERAQPKGVKPVGFRAFKWGSSRTFDIDLTKLGLASKVEFNTFRVFRGIRG